MSPHFFSYALVGQVVALMCYIVYLGSITLPEGEGTVPPDRDAHKKHLYWKLFYLNPNDPRGWLPKVYGVGYTVNFRRPVHVHLFVALILLIFATAGGLTWAALSG